MAAVCASSFSKKKMNRYLSCLAAASKAAAAAGGRRRLLRRQSRRGGTVFGRGNGSKRANQNGNGRLKQPHCLNPPMAGGERQTVFEKMHL